MAWMRFDTSTPENPKIIRAVKAGGGNAGWLWFAGNCYGRRSLTDGFIPDDMIASVAPGLPARALQPAAEALVAAGLWHRESGGYRIHDFLDWNPSRAKVDGARAQDAARKRKGGGDDPSPDGGSERSHEDLPVGDSERMVSSPPPGLARAGADAGALISPVSPLSPPSGSVVEMGSGRTKPGGRGLITGPLAFDRIHGAHVEGFCDFVCFPRLVFDDFVNRVVHAGAAEPEADAQVRTWALSVRQAWQGRIPGADIFKFWRHEWESTHGDNAPARGGVDVTAGLRRL